MQANEFLIPLSIQAPKEEEIWVYLGFNAGKKSGTKIAIEYFLRVVSTEPAFSIYGIALRDVGRINDVLEALRKFLLFYQADTETHDCFAHVYMLSGQTYGCCFFKS